MDILCRLLQLYVYVIFIRVLLSWFSPQEDSPFGQVTRVIALITDPVMLPLRRVLPPVRLGTMALDLSPIVALIGIQFIQGAIC